MYGVPFSSDESDSVVDSEQESDVSSQTDQSQWRGSPWPKDRTGVTVESYARWRTRHNPQSARRLGSQTLLESAQEADDDSQSTANSQGDDVADAPERLSVRVARWAAACFPWVCSPSSQPQFARRDTSPYIDDGDVRFEKSLSPAMSTTSLYEPADLAETTQGVPIFEQLYRAISSVLYEFDRFAQLVIPLAAAVLLISLFVLLGVGLYHGLPSYYPNLDESSAMCDFGLTSPFQSFCRTTNVTVDSPAMDIFVDIQIMTECWISTIEAGEAAPTSSAASPEPIQTAQHDPTSSRNPPEPVQIGDAHRTSSAASPKSSQDSREGLPTIEAYPEARQTVKEPTVKRALSMSEACPEVSPMEESTHES